MPNYFVPFTLEIISLRYHALILVASCPLYIYCKCHVKRAKDKARAPMQSATLYCFCANKKYKHNFFLYKNKYQGGIYEPEECQLIRRIGNKDRKIRDAKAFQKVANKTSIPSALSENGHFQFTTSFAQSLNQNKKTGISLRSRARQRPTVPPGIGKPKN